MRQYVVLAVALAGLGLVGVSHSQADTPTTPTPDFCTLPNGSVGGCVETATPVPTATQPAEAQVSPVKNMSVSGGSAGPDGTVQYTITLTSKLACFAAGEPIDVFALGNASAIALSELAPVFGASSGNHLVASVDPKTGTALLSLEVVSSAAAPGGVDVKARWPEENIERVQNLIAPSPPTVTPTPYPGQPTVTATATATPGDTPTVTATPTSIPVGLTSGVQSCVVPQIMTGSSLSSSGTSAVLYGRTVPGTTCTADVTYYHAFDFTDYFDTLILDVTKPVSFIGIGQVANSFGIVAFPWVESSAADFGIGTVTCSPNGGPPQTACSAFLIQQDTTRFMSSLSDIQLDSILTRLEANHCPAGSTQTP